MKTIEENLHIDIGAWYRTYGITSLGILEGRGGQEERYREVGRGEGTGEGGWGEEDEQRDGKRAVIERGREGEGKGKVDRHGEKSDP